MTMKAIGFGRADAETVTGEKIVIPLDFRHASCSGSTGSGKSASVILPTLEDRIARGHTVLFFAYKGHEHRQVKAVARRHGRLEDVREFGKPHGTPVNILASLSVKDARQCIIDLGGGVGQRDPYWANTAGNFGEAILTALRHLYRLKRLYGEIDPAGADGLFGECVEIPAGQTDDDGNELYREIRLFGRLEMEEEPSFSDVYEIAKDAGTFNDFFAGIDPLLERLERKGRELMNLVGSFEEMRKVTEGYFLALSKLAVHCRQTNQLQMDGSNGSSTGNNGVRQTLENHLATIASREYANYGRKELVADGEIMVVDVEGVDDHILSIMLGNELERLTMRLRRERDPRPVSVFVDEANRVLPGGLDLHSDVLRETKVELIVAYQNEGQMIRKFTPEGWEAQKNNFVHRFEMMPGFRVHYRSGEDERTFRPEPLVLGEEELDEAEMEHNALPDTLMRLRSSFLVTDRLPGRCRIVYDPRSFSMADSILIEDEAGNTVTLEYLGRRAARQYRRMLGIAEEKAAAPAFPMLPRPGEDPRTAANDGYMWGRERLRHLDETVAEALDVLDGGEDACLCDLPFLEFHRRYRERRTLRSFGVLAEQAAFIRYLLFLRENGECDRTGTGCRERFEEFMENSSLSPFGFDSGEDMERVYIERAKERAGRANSGDPGFPGI